jgi:glycosyltransferase involved in cell wall biosynthesis
MTEPGGVARTRADQLRIGVMMRSANDVGGVGEYTRSLVHALLKADTRNRYFLFVHDEKAAKPFAHYPNALTIVLPAKSRLLWDQVHVPRESRKHRCDVIINLKHSLPLLTRARTILVMHGADWLAYPQNYYFFDRLYHALSLPVYCGKADRIVAVSHDAANLAVRGLRLPQKKMAVIYHGCRAEFEHVTDAARLAEVRAKYQLPERFILYVGRIYPMKNVRGLIEAFALLRDRVPHHLVISGVKYYKTEAALEGIDRHGLADRVVLTGFVEDRDLPAIYSLADVYVMPSLYEGFGIPLLEAMASECPIVASSAGSCPEVTAGAAETVDPKRPDDIARGLEKVLKDRGYAAQLVERGRRRVADFSWEKSARDTLALIESLVP